MLIDATTLAQVTIDVCTTMLDLQLTLKSKVVIGDDPVVGCVTMLGGQSSTVEVETSREVAVAIASQMFSLYPMAITSAEIIDAIGEIANMIGGNLKGILNSNLDLTVPHVEFRAGTPWTPKSSMVECHLECSGGAMIVRRFLPLSAPGRFNAEMDDLEPSFGIPSRF